MLPRNLISAVVSFASFSFATSAPSASIESEKTTTSSSSRKLQTGGAGWPTEHFAPSAAPPFVSTCDSTFSRQLWNFSSNKLQSLSSSSCLATVDCNPIAGGDVTMIDCDIKQCNNILWNFDTQGRLVSLANPNLCLTLANVDGPDINLWECKGAVENGLWNYSPSSTFSGYGLYNTRDTNAGLGCLTNPNGGTSLIVLNTS